MRNLAATFPLTRGGRSSGQLPPLVAVALLALLVGVGPVACGPPSSGPRGGAAPELSSMPPDPRYVEVAALLGEYIDLQLADKEIPGLSIALVDGQEMVWAEGFGFAHPEAGLPARRDTIYRVGSVSKLFTDLGVMRLVERGEIDLDAPITAYLSDFTPANPFGAQITLRQLMSHRGGLVREPPVGHYFDDSEPTLAATAASLGPTTLVYEPESTVKYSNAGIAVVGYVLEALSGEPFADYLEREVLEPIGMRRSAFAPDDAVRADLAHATMWSYDGRRFPAPTFELGMAPAGSMYAPVTDLAEFMKVLFAGGEGPGGRVLAGETLELMYEIQFPRPGQERGFGLGFVVGDFEGPDGTKHRSLGHGGAIYGFSTSFMVLPDERIGAVVVANMDVVNSLTGRIMDLALELMLARRAGRPLEIPEPTLPVERSLAERIEGRYVADDLVVDLRAHADELLLEGGRSHIRVKARGERLVLDDRQHDGPEIEILDSGALLFDGDTELTPVSRPKPDSVPRRFLPLLGEYGWDHNVLFVYERRGRLYALVEWVEIDPLIEVPGQGDSPTIFDLPDGTLYHGEQLVFTLGADGRATEAVLAGIPFPRRAIQGEGVTTFTIDPVAPIDEIRAAALAASPPEEEGDFRETDLVELTSLDPTIRLDIRYATTNNFMRSRFYDEPRAFLQREAAEALVRVHRALGDEGYGLLVHDAYRPWFVTRMFWDATPEDQKIFVADPARGSRHNRGCAVDLTLVDLATGEPVPMVGLYDEFSERSFPEYIGGTELQRWHRELLRDAMEAEGFRVYEYEWWHFDYDGWEWYRIGNRTFEEVEGG